MYVLWEYLVSLAMVALLGLALFAVAVVGLVGKSAANWVAATTAKHLPRIASSLSPYNPVGFKKNHQGPLSQS